AVVNLLDRCQCADGSYGTSPSATGFGLALRPEPHAAVYLERLTHLNGDGGVQFLYPCEIFETAWALHALREMPLPADAVRPHLQRLQAAWTSSGVSWSTVGTIPDVDDSAVTVLVLRRRGVTVDSAPLLQYEAEECFST